MSNITQRDDRKNLVIGSSGHKLADKCISWHQLKVAPYLGDYDIIIINLQSLDSNLQNQDLGEKLSRMRSEINEIIWANTEIICITDFTKKWRVSTSRGTTLTYSNYDWCPIYLQFDSIAGESFAARKEDGYFAFVKRWKHLFSGHNVNQYNKQRRRSFSPIFTSLLLNKANKQLAFDLSFEEYNEGHDYMEGIIRENITVSNIIRFLPPTTEISIEESINFLLKTIKGNIDSEEYSLPKWVDKIKIFKEESIKKSIISRNELITNTQIEIKGLENELSSLVINKQLLTEGGEGEAGKRLEDIVEKAFGLLGVNIKPGPKTKEDKIITHIGTKEEIPLEIGGFIRSVPERKLTQLIGRLTDDRRPEKIKCRGIVVGNHYKDISLDTNLNGRKAAFESDVIKKAKAFDVSLVSTLELFKAVNYKLNDGDVSSFIENIFNEPGEVIFK